MNLMLDDKFASIPWNEIDAVVFDVGNVLLSFHPQELLNRIIPERPDLHEELIIRVFKSPYWCMMDRGSVTAEEAAAAMAMGHEELLPYIQRIHQQWIDLLPIEEGIKTLKQCVKHGKHIYALTNYADKPFAHACNTGSFFGLFDDFLVSSRVGLVKPELAIYHELIARFQLNPERTVFIDDNIANIEGALECGLQTVCYNRAGKLDAFFVD